MRVQASNAVATGDNVNRGPGTRGHKPTGGQPADELLIFGGEIVNALKSTNEKLQVHSSRAEFFIHEKTGDIMVKILDLNTNEVLREIPPRKIKDMVANFLERAGLLVDRRA
ncbi:MAG TPA: flagellar protein FlaG [Bacillota bacterium]|nr:flagellar protein FlaG [Bacillota bacterium]